MHAKSLQLRPTLWDPMDCSPPGSSDREILQARILEWVAIPFSGASSRPRDQTLVSNEKKVKHRTSTLALSRRVRCCSKPHSSVFLLSIFTVKS